MSSHNLYLGKQGENFALRFLQEKGYKALLRNYRNKFGEIDIIARDNKDTLCFIEVKTRRVLNPLRPEEAVNYSKIRQISKTAIQFLKEKKLLQEKARFDVVSVDFSTKEPSVELFKDAFDLSEDFTY